MSTQTTNYGLEKPDVGDFYDVSIMNDNLDIIDTTLKSKADQTEVDSLKKSVSDGKATVANAITGKGVATASDATFATMATNIGSIKVGIDTSGATASTADILTGKTAGVGGAIITGTMVNNGAVNQALNSGGSYIIPIGYHNGNGKVTANSLASQTSATADAGSILNGKTAYVNGSKITGNIPIKSEYTPFVSLTGGRSAATDAVYVRIPQGAYLSNTSAGYPEITMTLADVLNGTGIMDRGVYGGGCSSAALYENRVYLRFPQGYYHGGSYDTNSGEAELYIPYTDLASLLGITAGKILTGNTICGVAGTANSVYSATVTTTTNTSNTFITVDYNGNNNSANNSIASFTTTRSSYEQIICTYTTNSSMSTGSFAGMYINAKALVVPDKGICFYFYPNETYFYSMHTYGSVSPYYWVTDNGNGTYTHNIALALLASGSTATIKAY